MKIFLIPLLVVLTLASACSTRKTTLSKPAASAPKASQPVKTIGENTLVNKYSAQDYIERFKAIAIKEMNSYGIPASITLAQGLLESGNGNSSLARDANNHFGIKCTSEWRGKTILKDDDEKDDCFRVYATPEESFRDHSEFLKRKRYAALFELDKNDYRGWAAGLKEAGYATNPRYAELLITLVDRYDLSKYDRREGYVEKIKREDKVLTEIARNIPEEKKQEPPKTPVSMKIYEVKQGDTMYSIAKRFTITIEELKILNDLGATDLKMGQLLLVSK
ncbi:MAG: glucosaminidase domain-containing protein [Daejeonella sp.]|uniref:glucosaminidase domain-containing protein n=1 Tax=Daejeonella sp. JGW-45 TaxID=3034148 RepID=UPI0023EBBA43|nr:glucosaminidase domain-containing protein [Daejeonella sp. JGW-45]